MKRLLITAAIVISFFCANAQLKQPLYGLACRDFKRIQSGDDDVMKNIHTIIVQLYWSDIQPKEGGPIERNNAVDNALDWVRSFNKKNGTDIGLKIRLYCGARSPQWLISKVGYFSARDQQFPKFWKPDFINAFADVQQKLAAIYDDVPEVHEIVDGGTGMTTAENFIRPFGKGPNAAVINSTMSSAGYNAELDSIAIVKSFDAMKAWKKTLVSVCFSDWKTIDKNGSVSEDVSRTLPFIKKFVDEFGKQAVIGNNGLRPGTGHHGERWQEGGDMFAIYNYFKKLHDEKGVQVYFQTAKDERIGNLQDAINDGIDYGASYIELPGTPRAYAQDLPVAAMGDLNKKLKDNLK